MCAEAFTTTCKGKVNVLKSQVYVFDTQTTPEKQHNQLIASGKGFCPCVAIWDTGATGSCITRRVADILGLQPISFCKVSTAGGEIDAPVYKVDIKLPNNVVITDIFATECVLAGADVLIGMDVITTGEIAISNYKGQTVFTFRVPSITVTDYVRLINAQKPQPAKVKIGPNDLCPCGSGKKYKRCHGRR